MERVKKVVVDASVVARWFVKEEDYEKALEVRRDYERGLIDIIAPQLLIYEVTNALRYCPELEMKDIVDSAISLIHMQLDLRTMDEELVKRTVDAAYTYKASVYDSCYYALAKILKIKLLTADRKLYEKVHEPDVVLLTKYDQSAI